MLQPPIDPQPSVIPEPYLMTTRCVTPDGSAPGVSSVDHQVVWPHAGSCTVGVAGRTWSLTPGQGMWLPSGTLHRVRVDRAAEVYTTYLAPFACTHVRTELRTAGVPRAVREMLFYLAFNGMVREQRFAAQRLCIDLIDDEVASALEVPHPVDRRIRGIASAILADPTDDRTLDYWAWHTSTSPRTIARVFRADTGMSFSRWRTSVRISAALELLGAGTPVTTVAHRVGYATPSAFSAAFRRVVGRSPHQYLPHRQSL